MYITPMMDLEIWNQTSDPYNSQQLADNFLKIDQHDHSTGKGTPIPTAGIRDGAVTSSKIANGAIGTNQLASDVSISVPTGTILSFAGNTAPNNFLICNGQQVSRTTYANLFSIIGTIYGIGDGLSTFNVPNLQNLFMVGAGGTYPIGTTGGSSTTTLVSSNIPPHSHTVSITDPGHNHGYRFSQGATTVGGVPQVMYYPVGPDARVLQIGDLSIAQTYSYGGSIQNSTTGITAVTGNGPGSSQPVNNLPPFIALTFIIAT